MMSEGLTVADIKNAINAVKMAKEGSRKRWASPETVYSRGRRCYVLKTKRKFVKRVNIRAIRLLDVWLKKPKTPYLAWCRKVVP
jgi:hypothetical protein